VTGERPSARKASSRLARTRRLSDFHVLRYVPGSSPLHRAWAGTKMLGLAGCSIGLLIWPTWKAAGLVAALLLLAFLVAKLPRGLVPRLPRWVFLVLGVSFLLALAAGGPPEVHAGVRLGFGGVDKWALFSLIGLEVLALAALVSWTTQLADLAPALGRLAGPLRRLRVPVDEILGAIALSIRCLPLLLEEARILSAARRSRRPAGKRDIRSYSREAEEVMFAAVANALRRSRELAEAIEARGGVPTVAGETHRLRRIDLAALALAAAAVTGMGLLH
jgi:energy-coupling factor transporter transmembrane protein EcfT